MKLQNIIVFIIVLGAALYALHSLYTTIIKKKPGGNKNDCSSDCSCDAKHVRDELLKPGSQK